MRDWRDYHSWQTFPRWPGQTRLRVARLYAGLTQDELAEAAGVSRKTISSVERGRSTPSLALARSLAHTLGVSIDELFDSDELR